MKIYMFVDLETSGLDPEQDRIVEIGWMYADEKLRRITETSFTPVRPVGAALDRIEATPIVKEMHERTGLLHALKTRGDLPLLQAVETSILDELDQMELNYQKYRARKIELGDGYHLAENLEFVLAGKNVYFDKGFIEKHMPRLAKRLSHRTFDETSLKYLMNALSINVDLTAEHVDGTGTKLMQHRAGYDVEASYTTMLFVVEHLREMTSGYDHSSDKVMVMNGRTGEHKSINVADELAEDLRRMQEGEHE